MITRSKESISPNLEITQATHSDWEKVWQIIQACSTQMAEGGLNHWVSFYTPDLIQQMIGQHAVYLVRSGGDLVGTFTLGSQPSQDFIDNGYVAKFTDPNSEAMYLMALAVMPNLQGQGLAGELMPTIENIVRARGVSWLRLDCREEVPGLVAFYQKRGFVKIGDQPQDEGEDGYYWLMEKRLA